MSSLFDYLRCASVPLVRVDFLFMFSEYFNDSDCLEVGLGKGDHVH